jgi:hypothetical protein
VAAAEPPVPSHKIRTGPGDAAGFPAEPAVCTAVIPVGAGNSAEAPAEIAMVSGKIRVRAGDTGTAPIEPAIRMSETLARAVSIARRLRELGGVRRDSLPSPGAPAVRSVEVRVGGIKTAAYPGELGEIPRRRVDEK